MQGGMKCHCVRGPWSQNWSNLFTVSFLSWWFFLIRGEIFLANLTLFHAERESVCRYRLVCVRLSVSVKLCIFLPSLYLGHCVGGPWSQNWSNLFTVIFILINDGLSLSLNEVKGGNMFSGYWSFVLKERVYAYALCVCMCVCVCVCTCDVSKIV